MPCISFSIQIGYLKLFSDWAKDTTDSEITSHTGVFVQITSVVSNRLKSKKKDICAVRLPYLIS
jgi:hypothetical protein